MIRRPALALVASLASLAAAFPAGAAATPSPVPATAVVVQTDGGAGPAAAAVRALGGTVTADLPIVRGFAATLPASALDDLAAVPGVLAVTPDSEVTVQADDSTGDAWWMTRPLEHASVGAVNAYRLWFERVTGAGVRVALVDTGITDHADLRGRIVKVRDWRTPDGPLVDCVDFSGENSCRDSYGHGTFLAGLIAGDGSSSGGRFHGVAPRAELISIKIAGADGSADVSKVLAAIQWAVSFKDAYGIDVLNLSLGTDSPMSSRVDPLNHAVQRAWAAGLTVVVSASNRGPQPGTIAKPGDDPAVITVGSTDDRRTIGLADDRLPNFSGRGPTSEGVSKPDVVAPGVGVVSLRAPGSTIEQLAPGAGVDTTYRRGSGTSMATAMTAGVAALIHQANAGWTNDQVKAALRETAKPVATNLAYDVGRGHVDAYAAARLAAPVVVAPGVVSDASGFLDRSRGNVFVTAECVSTGIGAPQCMALRGERTAQGELWSASEFAGSSWHGSSWHSSQWVDGSNSSWYASTWYGSSWHGSSWHGSSWHTPGDEPSETPFGMPIPGSAWYGVWS